MKKQISAFLSAVMLISSVHFVSAEVTTKTVFPEIGGQLYGYTVTAKGYFDEAQADTIVLHHNYSGADVLCLQNSDPNRAFSIGYRTPNTDESDRNHVFEHAILASSKKYPSDDIFFDLANRSFNSYVNAHTALNNTAYEFASLSEAQFEKMIDVYLSCMVAPDIMTNENFFKREALNYTLESRDADIEMGGTVYSEDVGFLTNMSFNGENAILDTLYPGETQANMIGQSMLNYQDLTYEHTTDLYDMCYHFDNSLIVLYGDIDYDTVLKFIDDEYLSKYPDNHTDLSAYAPVPSQSGHKNTNVYTPAFEGDTVEGASVIYYAFDLYGISESELCKYLIISDILNNDNSPIRKNLDDAGIYNDYYCSLDIDSTKPFLYFSLQDTDESKKDTFGQIIKSSLEEIAQNGIGDIYDTYFEKDALSSAVSGGSSGTGVNLAATAICFWATYDDPNTLSIYSDTKAELKNDNDQAALKSVATDLLDCDNTALIAAIPKPGEAEKVFEQTDAYLKEMKAGMTDAQLDAMIADTQAYNAWLNDPITNDNVSIDPEDLPEYTELPEVKTSAPGGIKTYSVDINKSAGCYQVRFDASTLTKKELYWAALYNMLIGQLGTDTYTKDEVMKKLDELLFGVSNGFVYNKTTGENKPSLKYSLSWYEYAKNYRSGLEFGLDILQNTDFNDTETVISVLESDLPYYDAARTGDPLGKAQQKALAAFGDEYGFSDYLYGEGFYNFLCEQLDKLKNEKGYADTFAQKLDGISKKIIRRDNISVIIIGNKDVTESVKKINKDILGALPSVKGGGNTYTFEEVEKTSAYIGEFPNQYSTNMALCGNDFRGEYIPFISYINDVYSVPELRFKNGAYSGGTKFLLHSSSNKPFIRTYSYSDPNVGLTIDTFNNIKDVLPNTDITQEQLDNYITASYSMLYTPLNDYQKAIKAVRCKLIGGGNTEKTLIDQIRNATVDDKAAAAEAISNAMENSATVMLGNANAINAEKDVFDEVTDMRKN